jgi:hypothetical protein
MVYHGVRMLDDALIAKSILFITLQVDTFLLPYYAVGNAGNFIIAAMRTSNLACSKYFQVRFSTRTCKTPWNPVTYYDLRVNERNTSLLTEVAPTRYEGG